MESVVGKNFAHRVVDALNGEEVLSGHGNSVGEDIVNCRSPEDCCFSPGILGNVAADGRSPGTGRVGGKNKILLAAWAMASEVTTPASTLRTGILMPCSQMRKVFIFDIVDFGQFFGVDDDAVVGDRNGASCQVRCHHPGELFSGPFPQLL